MHSKATRSGSKSLRLHWTRTTCKYTQTVCQVFTYPSLLENRADTVLCAVNPGVPAGGTSFFVLGAVTCPSWSCERCTTTGGRWPIAVGSLYWVCTMTPSITLSVLCALDADLMSMKATMALAPSPPWLGNNLTLCIFPWLKRNKNMHDSDVSTFFWNYTKTPICQSRISKMLQNSKLSHKARYASATRNCNVCPCHMVIENALIRHSPPGMSYGFVKIFILFFYSSAGW